MSLGLTPAGHLRWAPLDGDDVPAGRARLQRAFDADWREALFTLAAEKTDTQGAPGLRYWQEIAERHLTALCHVPENAEDVRVDPPGPEAYADWVLTAPPMHGGEYLSEDSLERIWTHLDEWVRERVPARSGLAAFLRERAPRWHQVGRVCFHLAENKNDEARPFAFMATYASGFGASGRVKHLPLRRALQQYAGVRNRAALIKLLSPIEQAGEACGWVHDLVESGRVYQPMAWSAERAYEFLGSVPALEEAGLSVRLPNWWRKRARPQVRVTIGGKAPARLGVDAMLDFEVECRPRRRAAVARRAQGAARRQRQPRAAEGPMGRGGPRQAAAGHRSLGHPAAGRQRGRVLHRGHAAARRRVGGSPARGTGGRRTLLGARRRRRRHARDTREHASARRPRSRWRPAGRCGVRCGPISAMAWRGCVS